MGESNEYFSVEGINNTYVLMMITAPELGFQRGVGALCR